MRILITGGAGFLGANLAYRLRRDHLVVTLDAGESADMQCDMRDSDAVRAAVKTVRPDAIVHLAAWLTTDAHGDPVGATAVNALGTAVLFAAGAESGVRRIVYASSVAAVGPCAPGTGDDARLMPGTVYGVTKAFGEELARVLSSMPDAPRFVSLRFGWVYGPGRQRGWREVQQIVERVVKGERQIDYPDFPDAMDWTWIGDAVAVLEAALSAPVPRFIALNVVGDKRKVRDAVAHLVTRYPDLEAHPIVAATPASAWGLVNDRIADVLGYAPDTPLERGLDALISSIRDEAGMDKTVA